MRVAKIIHKRIFDKKCGGDTSQQLCDPNILFTGKDNSYDNPRFQEWTKIAKHTWKKVTCPDCINIYLVSRGAPPINRNNKVRLKQPNASRT